MQNPAHKHRLSRRQASGGAIGLVLLLLVGLSTTTQSLLTAHERTQYPAPGKMVSVGTHRLHLHCQGSGKPLVVLESGLSGWSQDWALVQPALGQRTQVCSYDRAGYAWSDEAPEPRTGLLAVEDLRTLLRNAGLQGPVVVVGHSWGGMLAQMLAQTHPEEVAGLVLVDSLHHDQAVTVDAASYDGYNRHMRMLTGSATWLAPLGLNRLLGLPASVIVDKLPASERPAAQAFAFQGKNFRALHTEYLGIDPALAVARTLPAIGHIPVKVLSTHALRDFPPGWESPSMRHYWQTEQQALGRDLGTTPQTVPDAGHYLQIERPELVIQAVEDVLQSVRAASRDYGPAHS